MKSLLLLLKAVAFSAFFAIPAMGQLSITTSATATALAQKLAGEGVTILNATLSGGSGSKGFFINQGNTQINIDSGVVMTTGRAKTAGFFDGVDGDGFTIAGNVDASSGFGLPGDADLAALINLPVTDTRDASILEFDFIPIGDTIRFNYVFSSEEYNPDFVCEYNDAFAFFISGPGITGLKNIALIPGTNTPVSIFNVNNVQSSTTTLCPNNIAYYVDNFNNKYFTHDGHTTVLTAISEVQPCQTYHLKLVIMDVADDVYDSGVFLEAGSLRSDPLKIDGHTPLNEFGLPYLAEGCVPGAIHITRSRKKPYPQPLTILFGGTAVNGVDVTTIPSTVTIPANDSVVVVPVSAIPDFITEGHEVLKIFIANNCATVFSDSIQIELRDIDLLTVTPVDSARICRNGSIPLTAADGYINYSWTNGTTLANNNTANPMATPVSDSTNYICTATIGNCRAQDSVLIRWKTMKLVSKTDIPCKNGTTGAISVSGSGWSGTPSYAINNGTFQSSNSFTGLPAGDYWVKMKDASGCVDSMLVSLVQSFPDLEVTATTSPATCSITPDGTIQVSALGGNNNFQYSSTGTSYQPGNTLIVSEGNYTVFVKDGNGCISTYGPVNVPKINTITLDAGADTDLCEGKTYTIQASSNVTDITWFPVTALTNTTTLTPTTSAIDTTKYYVKASFGTCTRLDSVMINVWPAPVPEAGDNQTICYGITARLNGSGGIEYSWTTDPSFVSSLDIPDAVVKPAVTSTYYLHVKDIHGCNSLQSDAVTINVTPSVKIFAGRDTLVAMNQPLQLNAVETNNSGVTDWEWSPALYFNDPNVAAPVATFPVPVTTSPFEYTYRVTGTTPEGCQGWDDIKIKVWSGPEIYVPGAFTPNGDGRNDQLTPLPVGIKDFHFFRVFNRWGQLVYETKNPGRGWDGRIAGALQSTGVFIWMAEGIDYTGKMVSRKGSTTLVQ